MYSFHSSPEEKNKILFALAQHGIETTVDRVAKKKRIRDWIQESVIREDDEEEEEEEEADEDNDHLSSPPAMSTRKPIAGHVSSVRAQERADRKQIKTTLKDASNKHINPRTGQIQHGPSEMGPHASENAQNVANGNGNVPSKSVKLKDVGSQTSSESQKQSQTPERAGSYDKPTIVTTNAPASNVQGTQTNLIRRNSTSHGLMSAFNSLASISIPESSQPAQTSMMPAQRETPQRQGYLQRHNTIALTKHQPTATNSLNNLINDSGYGSLDKLRLTEGNTVLSSPLLSKRSIVQSAQPQSNGTSNGNTNGRNNLNGLSHQNSGSTSSPFHSDSGGDGSPRGSNGFVNLISISASTPTIAATSKDTAYDRVRHGNRRMKKWINFFFE